VKGLRVTAGKKGCTFGVHVVPRSRQDAVIGLYGEALKLRLKAPPVEGQANQALRAFLADRLGVRREAVEILSGRASRHKVVRVRGIQVDQVHALLGGESSRSLPRGRQDAWGGGLIKLS
jgi:uncharacterized protein (TIGR00251 family)